ncbi:MAG: 1,4-dihydroxy-6-naphthoate synthase [Hyphomicrobiales bacterium]
MPGIQTIAPHSPLQFGYSPCPNDTFMFFGIASGEITLPDCAIEVQLHDIETLNRMAFSERLDISKLSIFAWLKVRDTYRLMRSGAALGYGCGPIVIAPRSMTRAEVIRSRIALPGEWTTAHLLFRLWAPEAEQRYFTAYHSIYDELASGRADCGVIIHESRFTFEQQGFKGVVDLGQWWEEQTGLPVPLGCIAARSALGPDFLQAVDGLLRRSIETTQKNPDAALPYIRQYAQEMDPTVLRSHIATFVNSFSLDIGTTGLRAVDAMEQRARAIGVLR